MEIIQEYQDSLDFLYSHIDFSLTRNLRYSTEKFNLDRMVKFMDILGNPHRNYPVIHVAGTKGKGSICAMLANILTQAGFRTGFYSSPHMIEFTERIRIGNEQISKKEIIHYVNKIKDPAEKVENISMFELITGIAFKYFSDENLDIAVVEVGMGGRLDATNVVLPLVSVISSISLDHMKVLGRTIKKIAREKGGIIKNETPVVISPMKASVEKVMKKIANERQAEIIDVKEKYAYKINTHNLSDQTFEIIEKKLGNIIGEYTIPLLGDHQVENALTVYAVIQKLIEVGWRIRKEAIKVGFQSVQWPGRFEVVRHDPLIIIDCAHNPDSFRKLSKTISKYLKCKKIIFIFGASEDKQVKLMLRVITPLVNKMILTSSDHPRALSNQDLEVFAKGLRMDYLSCITVEESLKCALKYCDSSSAIVASGSIFIAGAVKQLLEEGFIDE